jgi:hypothetical protein
MATAHEIRELVAQTTTGTRRRHLPRQAIRCPGAVTLARDFK